MEPMGYNRACRSTKFASRIQLSEYYQNKIRCTKSFIKWSLQDIVHSKRQHDVRTIEQNSRQSSPRKATMKLERKVEIRLHGTAYFAHSHEQQACIHSYGRISLISAEEKKACQYCARELVDTSLSSEAPCGNMVW